MQDRASNLASGARSLIELCAIVDRTAVQSGGLYRHVTTGDEYRVLAIALMEADHVPAVCYRRRDGAGPTWIRPASEFNAKFETLVDAVDAYREATNG